MRLVLAVDELLGHKIRKTLTADIEVFARARLRLEGVGPARAAIDRAPCVFAIGAAGWDPFEWLESQRVSASVPVVVIVPDVTDEIVRRALLIGVRAIVPATIPAIALATSAACQIAWNDRGKSGLRPILVVPDRRGKQVRQRTRGQQTEGDPTPVALRRA